MLDSSDSEFENEKRLFDEEKYAEVIKESEKVKKDSDKYLDAVYLKAFSIAKLCDFKKALIYFKYLMGLSYKGYEDDYSLLLYNMGVCYFNLSHIKRAYLYLKCAMAYCNKLEYIPRTFMLEGIIFRDRRM